MKKIIDNLDNLTDWTVSDPLKANIHGLNDFPEYIANDLLKSLILEFKSGGLNAYCEKSFTAINVSDYNYIIINFYSIWKKNKGITFNDKTKFIYKIDFNASMTSYYVPVYSSMSPVVLSLEGITSIDKIRITALHDEQDYIIISECLAIKDQLPLDIYKAFQDLLKNKIIEKMGNGILAGTVTSVIGDKSISIDGNRQYLEKYAVIKIDDGVNSEIHQLMNNDEVEFKLSQLFDGNSIQNTFTNANVYLQFPVEFGMREKNILLPGITVYGMKGNFLERGSKATKIRDSYQIDGTLAERKESQMLEWEIFFDCIARHDQLLAEMSECIRGIIGRNTIWINGRRFYVTFLDNPIFIEAVQPFNEIPKLIYSAKVEIKEDIYDRVRLPETTTINLNINISNE